MTTPLTAKMPSQAFLAMTPESLHERQRRGDPVFVFDANSAERYDEGHVPGAVHMPPDAFDAGKLPPDRQAMLVFYCGGPRCRASHAVAEAARQLGYSNLWVMTAGIPGWEAAGMQTEP